MGLWEINMVIAGANLISTVAMELIKSKKEKEIIKLNKECIKKHEERIKKDDDKIGKILTSKPIIIFCIGFAIVGDIILSFLPVFNIYKLYSSIKNKIKKDLDSDLEKAKKDLEKITLDLENKQ